MLGRIFLIWLTLLSHYRRHKAQGLFFLLGLSLAVALFLSTLLIGNAAKSAFQDARQTLGREVVAELKPVNGRPFLSDALYRDLKLAGVQHIMPVIEGRVRTDHGFLQITGADVLPLLNGSGQFPLGPWQNQRRTTDSTRVLADVNELLESSIGDETGNPLFSFMFPPYVALISESYASLVGLADRSELKLVNKDSTPVRVVSDDFGLDYALLCDLRCAQAALGADGLLTSIEFTEIPEDKMLVIADIIEGEAKLEKADRTFSNPAFTDAFILNLQGIGVLAFLVGCFIAFNAANFAVLQRQSMVKQLRLCGASLREVLAAFALELLTWTLLASIFGCVLGWYISSALLPVVGLTLNQLFFSNAIPVSGNLTQGLFLAGLLSVGAVCLSAGRPFLVLAKLPPLGQIRVNHQLPFSSLAMIALTAGTLLWWLPVQHSQFTGFIIVACWFVGGALSVPLVLGFLYRRAQRLSCLKRYPLIHWLVAAGNAEQLRTSVAMMAFSVAMAASIAIMTMVVSFEAVFTEYLDSALSESLYLRLDSQSLAGVETELETHPAVLHHYRFYEQTAVIQDETGIVRGLGNHPLRRQSVPIEAGAVNLWQRFHNQEGVIINQALALSENLRTGDVVELSLNDYRLTTKVLGIYYSYGSLESGLVIDQQWLLTLWPGLRARGLAFSLLPMRLLKNLPVTWLANLACTGASIFSHNNSKRWPSQFFGKPSKPPNYSP